AGKSTLMRILAGFYPDYEGEIYLHGKLEKLSNPRQASALGIAMVHQELALVPELSVAENILLGREMKSRIPGIINRKKGAVIAAQVLSEIGSEIPVLMKIKNLSIAKQQLVEIAKGISMNSEILILDEPTSSLTTPEIKDLFKVIRTLKKKGVAIVYISHKLSEVFEIADEITVLRDGTKVGTKPTIQWNESSLVKAMVGRELSHFFSRSYSYIKAEVILEAKNITRLPFFKNVSFKLYAGEVLGIYGLVGAGRTEMVESIFGLCPMDCGSIYSNNRNIRIRNPIDAIKNEIVLVPEDRRTLGIISTLDVRKNLSLPSLNNLCNFGFVKQKAEMNLVEQSVRNLDIRIPSYNSPITALSGGNQQKIVFGKWLNVNPKVLILDDPTRGIDVGAKVEIREIIDRLASQGIAIFLISSELPEIIGMSDRVLVMREGRLTGEFSRAACSEEVLGSAAAGVELG
ncbi:MAG: sugar ABC transporter ATP-binding protein, partial [Spirochaetota bacterium]